MVGIVDGHWFTRIGLPFEDDERARITGMLDENVEIVVVTSWLEAARILDAEDRNSQAWDAQEEERERLWELGSERHTESELLALMNAVGDQWAGVIRDAAQVAAERAGTADPRFALEASSAAQLAISHSELAGLASVQAGHPFHRTLDVFVHGRWPLGVVNGRAMIF